MIKCWALVAAWFVAYRPATKRTAVNGISRVLHQPFLGPCSNLMLRVIISSSHEVSCFQINLFSPEIPFVFWRQASLINCQERRWAVVCYIGGPTVFSLVVFSLLKVFRTKKRQACNLSRKGGCVNFLSVLHSSCCSA
jgi:hypothetical protein